MAAFGLLVASASQAAVVGYDTHWLDAPADSYYAEPVAINNQRQVAGLVDNHAALWNASLQPVVSSVPASRANDINNLGQIVGTSGDPWDPSVQGVLWSPAGVPRAIGMLPAAINDAGQIVGDTGTGNNAHAVMWDGTKLVSLDGGKYLSSSASDIRHHHGGRRAEQ